MLAETTGSCDPETSQHMAAEILASHRDHLRELRVEFVEGGVVICGRAVSFYGKQIAFHELSRRCRMTILANEIEVQLPTE